VSKQQVVVKLRSVFNEWNELKRSKSRPSSERRERFIASLDRLFDIGVKDESKIELQEDRDFYRSMKEDRKARMSSVDVKWVQKKTKKLKRLQGQKRLKRRSDADIKNIFNKQSLDLHSGFEDMDMQPEPEPKPETEEPG